MFYIRETRRSRIGREKGLEIGALTAGACEELVTTFVLQGYVKHRTKRYCLHRVPLEVPKKRVNVQQCLSDI